MAKPKTKVNRHVKGTFLFLGAFALLTGVIFFIFSYGLQTNTISQFPVGVDPKQKIIVENPVMNLYAKEHLSLNTKKPRQLNISGETITKNSKPDWQNQLATPTGKVLVIYPGERREEIVKNFGDILRWDNEERKIFSDSITEDFPELENGKFFPGKYVVHYAASPEEVANLVKNKFNKKILDHYNEEVASLVPFNDALIIASLLEREAYDFNDMRYISGIIWNRLFVDMPLQLDATLQYAKGSRTYEPAWWPRILPADKYIDSPFNTYKNKGLPPEAIANPSTEAMVAALNPRKTDCMFYFHDSNAGFHCSVTYKEHVASLRKIYGRGK